MYVYTYVCFNEWKSNRVLVCMYVCMYICFYICMYVCMYVSIYMYMYACMHVRMYMHVCMGVPAGHFYVIGGVHAKAVSLRSLCLPSISAIVVFLWSACMYVCIYYICMYVCMWHMICVCMYLAIVQCISSS